MSPPDNPIPEGLNYKQRVMADEVMHKNPTAKILPTRELPDKLLGIEDMLPIYHKRCKHVAFYYTHRIVHREMMTASRARDIKGARIEKGSAMICGSCHDYIDPHEMFMDKPT